MKNKMIALSMAILCVNVNAQAENLNREISTYTSKIDSIVSVEKEKMNSEMDVWKAKKVKKEISEEEYTSLKSKIAKKYSKSINAKIKTERKKIDSITMNVVQKSVFQKPIKNNNSDNKVKVNLLISNNKEVNTSNLLVSYSMTNLSGKSDFNLFNKDSDMRIGNTHSVEVYYRRTNRLGKETSPFFIHYGLAYRSDTYMPKKDFVFSEENDQLVLNKFQEGSLKRSKLRTTYITAPLEFSWKPTKHWQFGLGGYAGINTRNIIKVKYRNNQDKFRKYKNVIDTGVNPYIVGGKASISYRGFTLFLKKDFTPTFDNKADLNFKNNIQFGVVITDIGL